MAKVLLIDDDDDFLDSMALWLKDCGHRVDCAPNGREALAQLLTDLPDVVLLDLVMPEMDGASFLQVVRSYHRIQSLPVVVCTGFTDSPMVARAKSLDVNSVLIKG